MWTPSFLSDTGRILLREFSSVIHVPVAIHVITNPSDIHDSTYSTYTYKKHRNGSPTSENWKVRWLQSRCEATAMRMDCNAKQSARKAKTTWLNVLVHMELGQICSSGKFWKCTGFECGPVGSQARSMLKSEIEVRFKCTPDTAELHPAAGWFPNWMSTTDPGLLQAFNFQMTRVFHSHAAWTKLDYCSAPAQKSQWNSMWKHSNTQMGRIQDSRFSWPLYCCPSFSFSIYTPQLSICCEDSEYFFFLKVAFYTGF